MAHDVTIDLPENLQLWVRYHKDGFINQKSCVFVKPNSQSVSPHSLTVKIQDIAAMGSNLHCLSTVQCPQYMIRNMLNSMWQISCNKQISEPCNSGVLSSQLWPLHFPKTDKCCIAMHYILTVIVNLYYSFTSHQSKFSDEASWVNCLFLVFQLRYKFPIYQ